MSSPRTANGSDTALISYYWVYNMIMIINLSLQIHIPFSAPIGFMVPPLHGVFVAVSCSGTLDQGSPFRIQAHSNYSVVVAFWIFVVWAIYTCPVIGVRCCKAWDIHPVFEKMFFSFQILVLLYELFTSLAFFSHYPGDRQSLQAQRKSHRKITFCL